VKLVVKIGGSLLKEEVPGPLIEDIAALSPDHRILLVHGGGDVVTDFATRLGKEQRFVVSPEGIRSRYTDKETVEIYQMVMSGLLAKRLVLSLEKAGLKSISLAGADGSLLLGKRKAKLIIVDERGRKMVVEGGYTGRVHSVNAPLLELLLSQGYVPVVSPVAMSDAAEPLNIDGDRAASAIAAGVHSDAVLFATNVDGLQLEGKLATSLTPDEAKSLLPKIGFGMQKKVMAAVEAVEGGVKEAIICSGTRGSPLTKALAHDSCTVIARA